MKANAAVWFEIYVQDMPRAKKFYEAVFERELTQLDTPVPGLEMWQFEGDQNAYGTAGALVKMQGVPSAAIVCWCTLPARTARSKPSVS